VSGLGGYRWGIGVSGFGEWEEFWNRKVLGVWGSIEGIE
jgi:hypothetical protein